MTADLTILVFERQKNKKQFSYYKFSLNLLKIDFCDFVVFQIYEI